MRCLCLSLWILAAQKRLSSDTYEQSLILFRVQEPGHSKLKQHFRNSLFCWKMGTIQGPLQVPYERQVAFINPHQEIEILNL